MRDFSQDSQKQVVVLNDRTQAGSSGLDPSSIELVQNRRLLQDDIRGVEEKLNEMDPKGFGIKVTAKYYMQIFDRSKGVPRQREQQLDIQQPLQYFFAFDYNESASTPSEN